MHKRPNKDNYYLDIAKGVSARATCLRRRFGAVIVNRDQIISTGYVGAPRGTKNCIDIGICPREEANIPSGERYELCRSVHAEMNAIIHSSRQNIMGATLYLYGENVKDNSIAEAKPCKMCTRMIINSGIKKVIVKLKNGIREYEVEDWIKNDITTYDNKNIKGY